jgi:DnaK suppressor protein
VLTVHCASSNRPAVSLWVGCALSPPSFAEQDEYATVEWGRKVRGRGRNSGRKIGAPVRGVTGLQRYERLLLAKRDELSATRRSGPEALVPGAGGWHGDLVDQANSDAEAELQIRVHQSDAHLLRGIEEALVRIRQGRFGVCEMCKQPIPRARLEAVPWTRHCRECKERPSA